MGAPLARHGRRPGRWIVRAPGGLADDQRPAAPDSSHRPRTHRARDTGPTVPPLVSARAHPAAPPSIRWHFRRAFSGGLAGRKGFFAPGFVACNLACNMPPYIPPSWQNCTENPQEICAKILHRPPKGGRVNGFGGLDAAKNRRYHSGQAKANRPRPPGPAAGNSSAGAK